MTGEAELAARIAQTACQIREWCQRNDYAITIDDCIPERAAARVLGYRSPDALRKQVSDGRNLMNYRLRGNVRHYPVLDVARIIEAGWNRNGK
ncbi:hypothetical protein BJG93_24510 [Paraburkholderia sprentiae WSM5005]|uniref:DNA-binding protein n=1 Tax=Paraburkholderia sprentiae WSM5005 TaxID=754502 RepID=A0A1I9YQM3_9BURK|nr:hypothetical protein [Paraburkholderia sprentiae]APA88514.1 hypothetical protein BJG93_24510 [Paraburkholderia sprentiae WSM5005]